MFDSRTILVTTAQSSRALANVTHVQLPPGTITRWWISWPPGSLGMVHILLEVAGRQVIPLASAEDLADDAYTLDIPDELDTGSAGAQLTLRAFNTDGTYNHLVRVAWHLRHPPPPAAGGPIALLRAGLQAIFGPPPPP